MDGPSFIRKALCPPRHDGAAVRSLRAVREGRVDCVPDEFLNTPAPNLLQGLRALAGAIHPEIFAAAQGVRRQQPDGLAVATSKIT